MNSIAQATSDLLGLLNAECPRDRFPYAQFGAYQPDDFTSPMEEGLSAYLYRVQTGETWLVSYLLTAWSPDPLRQQELLGWAMATLEGAGGNLRLEIQNLPVSDLAAIWSMARAGAQPSVAVTIHVNR
ncbi:MAG: DUF4255 domain-containing protein [Bryobacteraceae bacterium]|nr:DUF4255 domain-containing protein [Bryobacteraceae bacterium]